MMRKIGIILIVKLILSILLVNTNVEVMFMGIDKAYTQTKVGTKEQLNAMNRTANPSFIDTCNNQIGKPFKLLVIGNSLTRHGIAENIGWTHVSGMAATTMRYDFVHLLFYKTENLLPKRKICLRIANLADFERGYTTFDFKAIEILAGYTPDVIVFQLGENVSFNQINTPSLFEIKYTELINCFKKDRNPIIICTTPFFPSAQKNQIIEQVVIQTRSYLADLSHLSLLDKENYAKDEKDYKGNRSEWKNEGIGIHPGDYGMRNIAQELFIIINATVNKSK
jgi:hypothetical protein